MKGDTLFPDNRITDNNMQSKTRRMKVTYERIQRYLLLTEYCAENKIDLRPRNTKDGLHVLFTMTDAQMWEANRYIELNSCCDEEE